MPEIKLPPLLPESMQVPALIGKVVQQVDIYSSVMLISFTDGTVLSASVNYDCLDIELTSFSVKNNEN